MAIPTPCCSVDFGCVNQTSAVAGRCDTLAVRREVRSDFARHRNPYRRQPIRNETRVGSEMWTFCAICIMWLHTSER